MRDLIQPHSASAARVHREGGAGAAGGPALAELAGHGPAACHHRPEPDRRATARAAAPASAAASRSLRISSWGAEYRTVAIGPGGLSYLEVHQAASPGWTATLNGHRLTPVTLDGWQQAFVVPAGAGGTVIMTFTPATGYHWLLAGSVLAVCVLIAAAAWPPRRGLRRTRGMRRVAADTRGPGARAGSAGPVGYWLAAAAAALLLALAGGPVATRGRGRDPAGLVATAVGAMAGVRRDVRRGDAGHHRTGPRRPARLRPLRLARAGRCSDRTGRCACPGCSPAMADAARRRPHHSRRMTRDRASGSAPGVRPGLASWPLTPIEELDLYLENAAEPSVIQLELRSGSPRPRDPGRRAGRRAGR